MSLIFKESNLSYVFLYLSFWKDHLIIICLDSKTQRYENNLFDNRTVYLVIVTLYRYNSRLESASSMFCLVRIFLN